MKKRLIFFLFCRPAETIGAARAEIKAFLSKKLAFLSKRVI